MVKITPVLGFLVPVFNLKSHQWRYRYASDMFKYCIRCDTNTGNLRPFRKERLKVLEFIINRDDAKNIRTGQKFGKFGGC